MPLALVNTDFFSIFCYNGVQGNILFYQKNLALGENGYVQI